MKLKPRFAGTVMAALAVSMTLSVTLDVSRALAVGGSELNANVGVWAPLLPDLEVPPAGSQSQDDVGVIVGLSGHHRFEGYRTNIEGSIFYGHAGDTSLFGFEGLLRDTWEFDFADLSAGGGYSQMTFDQDVGGANLESAFRGAKVVAGWESVFGNRPIWIDLGLGLYDLNGTFTSPTGSIQEMSEFTTTYSVALKTDTSLWGVAARPTLKLEYLSDIATFQGGRLGTDDAVILSAMIELSLLNR